MECFELGPLLIDGASRIFKHYVHYLPSVILLDSTKSLLSHLNAVNAFTWGPGSRVITYPISHPAVLNWLLVEHDLRSPRPQLPPTKATSTRIYSASSCFVYAYFLIPKTKDISLEQVARVVLGQPRAFMVQYLFLSYFIDDDVSTQEARGYALPITAFHNFLHVAISNGYDADSIKGTNLTETQLTLSSRLLVQKTVYMMYPLNLDYGNLQIELFKFLPDNSKVSSKPESTQVNGHQEGINHWPQRSGSR
ncbi:hypothetical protein BDP27DRAFT_1366106 [Rhodocollybia butyracea]|uniref:Uncharacterized protein n=1 Tax=Rhodocollybia butyracea TaxID=206335 RepID=A0A9P5PPX8_9AGAR|nr:hypothetical protein BDP27DRAFT_1366106 [Rhodocollybia butyracea]